VTRLKVGRAYALIVRPLPPSLGIKGPALVPMIMVDGVGVNVTT